jgi:hypothetical protein
VHDLTERDADMLGASAAMLADLAFQNVLEQATRMRAWLALAMALSMVACNDETIENVPQDVCVSGKRWIGGRRGSEEMYPGRDCVGCHLENDGPQLMAGGTVYGFPQGRDGAAIAMTLGKPQSVDCFGFEGATVTLIGADLEEFTTVTNRAGNFFFEGRPDELAKPFQARVDYTVPGTDARKQMFTRPSYGGCGRCHSTTAVALDPPPDDPIDQVTPAGDYINLALSVTEFLDESTAYAGTPADGAHARSVEEIEDFVNDNGGH